MVLLTSSAISMAISSAVVCVFTFLLFLSGYVLQQQTVRSLQEALHRPPEVRPTPTLPKAFQRQKLDLNDKTSDSSEIPQVLVLESAEATDPDRHLDHIQVTLVPDEHEQVVIPDQQHPDLSNTQTELSNEDNVGEVLRAESLAYMLTIPQPSDLCSAVLFAKLQRKQNRLSPPPSIIFFYPTKWETGTEPLFTSAVELLRDVQEELSIIYHPVQISTVWEGVGVEPQLLSEVQTLRWSYDRAIYLRFPGFTVDSLKLDTILSSSSLKRSWGPLKTPSKKYPDVLMLSATKGILAPRNELRQLTIPSSMITSNQIYEDKEIERIVRNAAYIYVDEDRRSGKFFEQFESEEKNLCFDRRLFGNGYANEPDLDLGEEEAR